MAGDDFDYSDMSGPARAPDPGPLGTPETVDPRRFIVPAMIGGWIVMIAVLTVAGLPLWIVGAVAFADLVAIYYLARSLGRGSQYGR